MAAPCATSAVASRCICRRARRGRGATASRRSPLPMPSPSCRRMSSEAPPARPLRCGGSIRRSPVTLVLPRVGSTQRRAPCPCRIIGADMDRGPAPRAERRRLTHLDRTGRPRMVDVSTKPPTARRAIAEAFVALSPETLSLVIDGRAAKGDVLSTAELAGVMGGKRTSELIPLCHPLALTDLLVTVTPDRAAGGLRIRAEAATTGPTGVEMEALTAASVAALTAYDMVKSAERGVEIRSVH